MQGKITKIFTNETRKSYMITQKLNEFKIRNDIKSVEKWAEMCGVSKSTIVRALKGDHKDIGVYTLDQMLKPWNGSVDELLGIGVYSAEAIEKEETKNAMAEMVANVIDAIENSDEIPHEPTQEIKAVLEDVHEYITSEPAEPHKCVACETLREMIAELKQEKATKDKWLFKLFGMAFSLIALLIITLIIIALLAMALYHILHQ